MLDRSLIVVAAIVDVSSTIVDDVVLPMIAVLLTMLFIMAVGVVDIDILL